MKTARQSRRTLSLVLVLMHLICVFSGAVSAAPTAPTRLMFAGDSITVGIGVCCPLSGYRGTLTAALSGDGYVYTTVGPKADGNFAENLNEGFPGATIGDLLQHLRTDLTLYSPDVIVLHIGTNDLYFGSTATSAAAALSALVDTIYSKRPGVRLVLCSIIPAINDTVARTQAAFNALVPGIVASNQSRGRSVFFCDLYNCGIVPADINPAPDEHGVHPLMSGYNKMAAGLLPVVEQALDGSQTGIASAGARMTRMAVAPAGAELVLGRTHSGVRVVARDAAGGVRPAAYRLTGVISTK